MSTFEEKFPNGIGAIDPVTHAIVVSLCAVADEIRELRLFLADGMNPFNPPVTVPADNEEVQS